MDDPFISEEPKKSSNAFIDTLLIASGLMFMLLAFCLGTYLFLRNSMTQMINPVTVDAEPFVYNGKQIYHVPAGSRQIEALSYSSQAPVVVMFDADW